MAGAVGRFERVLIFDTFKPFLHFMPRSYEKKSTPGKGALEIFGRGLSVTGYVVSR